MGPVLISYSHDSPEHAAKVKKLADTLRQRGVAAEIDQYVPKAGPEEGWPRWMNRMLKDSEHIIVVCSETYRRRFEGEEEPDRGRGVTWEGLLIQQTLYEAGSKKHRLRIVLFDDEPESSVPQVLRSFKRFHLPREYTDLYAVLTRQGDVQVPKVGEQVEILPSEGPELPKEWGDLGKELDAPPTPKGDGDSNPQPIGAPVTQLRIEGREVWGLHVGQGRCLVPAEPLEITIECSQRELGSGWSVCWVGQPRFEVAVVEGPSDLAVPILSLEQIEVPAPGPARLEARSRVDGQLIREEGTWIWVSESPLQDSVLGSLVTSSQGKLFGIVAQSASTGLRHAVVSFSELRSGLFFCAWAGWRLPDDAFERLKVTCDQFARLLGRNDGLGALLLEHFDCPRDSQLSLRESLVGEAQAANKNEHSVLVRLLATSPDRLINRLLELYIEEDQRHGRRADALFEIIGTLLPWCLDGLVTWIMDYFHNYGFTLRFAYAL